MERRKQGEGGAPRLCEALVGIVRVTTQSERTHWYKATTHAERAISQSFVGKKFARAHFSLTPAEVSICEPIAWLSELTKQRQYIGLAIENLSLLI